MKIKSTKVEKTTKPKTDSNTLLADGLKLLAKINEDIKECGRAEKRIARRGEYTDCIRIRGMVDAYKKVRWDLEKVLNLR